MDAHQRLHAARKAALDGRHAEALAEFIWFHHHAVDEMPSLSAVRRSYALAFWKDLADVYRPALHAMEDARDQAARALLRGEAGVDAFRDVDSINQRLDTIALTHQLYVDLAAAQPELAKQCANHALPAVAEAKDFQLAAELLGDPIARIAQDTARFNRNLRSLQGRAYTRAPIRWAYTSHCTADIRLVLTILEGCGRLDEARQVRAHALKLIQSPSARRTVDDHLRHPHQGGPRTSKREFRRMERLYGKKK